MFVAVHLQAIDASERGHRTHSLHVLHFSFGVGGILTDMLRYCQGSTSTARGLYMNRLSKVGGTVLGT